MSNNKPAKVILWCTPRSVSTALTKCLSFVSNSVIWYEPYVAAMYYGPDSRYVHPHSPLLWKGEPGKDLETQAKQVQIPEGIGFDASKASYRWCQSQLEAAYHGKRVVFVKEISAAITTRFDAIPRGYKHSFLIRHPLKVLLSWKKTRSNKALGSFEELRLKDVEIPASGYFFKESYDLYQHIRDKYESDPIVIDADDLLTNPDGILKAYCSAMDIPYTNDLLHWDASNEIVKTWNVHRILLQLHQFEDFPMLHKAFASSEFLKPSQGPSRENLPEDDLQCIDFCMPYYEEMYKNRLIVKLPLIVISNITTEC